MLNTVSTMHSSYSNLRAIYSNMYANKKSVLNKVTSILCTKYIYCYAYINICNNIVKCMLTVEKCVPNISKCMLIEEKCVLKEMLLRGDSKRILKKYEVIR